MSRPVVILGAGGHARVLIEALLRSGRVIAGAVDADPARAGAEVMGIPILGGDEAVLGMAPDSVELVNGIGSTATTHKRREIFESFTRQGFRFATVIHPSAVIASDAKLGEGAQVMAGTVLQVGVRIGTNSIVNTRASVDHDCAIGDHVHIAPGVTLSGGVTVGDGAHVGTAATVIQGIQIAGESTVGAGSVVVRNVSQGATVYGVPAREVAR